jgi:CTP:molybdopterin cytidylyltransferase MocA
VIVGLVLAAGSGSRLGQPKADVLLGGVRLLDRAVSTLRAGGCEQVLAVVRSDTAPAEDVQLVVNPDPDSGMSSSLRAGLAALPAAADAVVITLVDLPGMSPAEVRSMIGWYRKGTSIVAARRAGLRSHPVLVTRRWFADLAESAHDDLGGRAFFAKHWERMEYLDCSAIDDIDTPADLARAEQALSSAKNG